MAAELQMRIREEAQELDDYVKEVEAWEARMQKLDEEISSKPAEKRTGIPDVRTRVTLRDSDSIPDPNATAATATAAEKGKEKEKSDGKGAETATDKEKKRISSWDYRSWDKFDADAAAAEVDSQPSDADIAKNRKKAEEEKETVSNRFPTVGNNLFRKGKFLQAADSYTRAMELDPKNAVLPANRAMCFMKLDKFNQAEADSTLSIKLDPTYAKAYFRRAAARRELKKYQDALNDLAALLELEPGNKQALDEKAAIAKLLGQSASAPSVDSVPKAKTTATAEPPKEPPHRPVIEVVGDSSVEVSPLPSAPIPPQSQPAAKSQPTEAQPSLPTPSSIPVKLELPAEPPRNFYEFSAAWISLEQAPQLRAELIKMVPVAGFPAFFKDSMSPSLLSGMLRVMSAHIAEKEPECAVGILQALTGVGRFGMLSMCLPAAEKQVLRDMASGPLKSHFTAALAAKWSI